jgi:esterase/lipase superfamily enzyme
VTSGRIDDAGPIDLAAVDELASGALLAAWHSEHRTVQGHAPYSRGQVGLT